MTKENNGQDPAVVKKSVHVNAPQAHAFKVFTERFGTWWPLSTHHIGEEVAETAIIEPRVGGRWFERCKNGEECEWGRVLVWEPPNRLVLSWDISANWKYDSKLGTEVDVRFFSEGPEATRVELEHRQLERYGAETEMMRATFESEGGWNGILREYVQAAENASNISGL